MIPEAWKSGPPENVKTKEWFTAVRMDFQQHVVIFLLCAYSFLIVATITLFFFQGFHVRGFNLDRSLLRWLGGATIGEIGGLLYLTFRSTFR